MPRRLLHKFRNEERERVALFLPAAPTTRHGFTSEMSGLRCGRVAAHRPFYPFALTIHRTEFVEPFARLRRPMHGCRAATSNQPGWIGTGARDGVSSLGDQIHAGRPAELRILRHCDQGRRAGHLRRCTCYASQLRLRARNLRLAVWTSPGALGERLC